MKALTLLIATSVGFSLVTHAEPSEKPLLPKPEAQELLERARKAKEEGRFEEAKKIAEQLREMHAGEVKKHEHPKPGAGTGEKPHLKPEEQGLLERARKAKEEGRFEEAKKIAEQLREKHGIEGKKHEHPQPGPEMKEKLGQMKAKLEELNREGKHDEAQQLRKHFAEEIMHHQKKVDSNHVDHPGDDRLGHLNEAIKHLRAAKLNEPAESLEQIARHMREEMEHQKHAGDKKPGGPEHEVQELREQVKRLSGALEEMRGQLRKQSEGEVRKPEKP